MIHTVEDLRSKIEESGKPYDIKRISEAYQVAEQAQPLQPRHHRQKYDCTDFSHKTLFNNLPMAMDRT